MRIDGIAHTMLAEKVRDLNAAYRQSRARIAATGLVVSLKSEMGKKCMLIRLLCGLTRRRIAAGVALGLMAGMALGQNVTIPWPTVTYKGSVELQTSTRDGNCVNSYTVPPGLKLRITSFLLMSKALQPMPNQFLCSGAGGECQHVRVNMIAPTGTTLPVALTSGILFNPGESVLTCNSSGQSNVTEWALYGFLYR